ncbi:MAG TPA: RHS repeat domain-containing protein [Armatimonadota bacterium]|nr:RHS repeat domain-containing protein [Armatimonadota bacterium]
MGDRCDSDGRLKTAATPKGKTEYGYDPGGRRASMVYSAGTVLYGYDRDNNLSELTSVFNEVTEYQWDLAERLTQVTLPNGSVVSLS